MDFQTYAHHRVLDQRIHGAAVAAERQRQMREDHAQRAEQAADPQPAQAKKQLSLMARTSLLKKWAR